MTSCSRARVNATYKAFNSSRSLACFSMSNAAVALGAGRLSLAKKTKLVGVSVSPGQSTSTRIDAAGVGAASVSKMMTTSASKPFAP